MKAQSGTSKPKPFVVGADQPAPTPKKVATLWRRMRGPLLVAVAGAATFALFHFVLLTRLPYAMLGTWVVLQVKSADGAKTNDSLKGGRLEFRRDGTMIGVVNMEGKEGKIQATVAVDEKTLRITTINPHTGQKVTDEQKILVLEGNHFEIEDRRGTVLIMERLRE